MVKVKGYGMTVESDIEKLLIKEGKKAIKKEQKEKTIAKTLCNIKCRKDDFMCNTLKQTFCPIRR